ncbi:MAG: YggT family protein [Bacillota bacterium]|nr:YggT family protein [Bacillota bacterium]
MLTVYTAIIRLIELLEIAVFIRCIISWIPNLKNNQLVRLLYQITEPVLAPVRALLERSALGRNTMVDLSPIIVFLLLDLLKGIIARALLVNTLF